MPCKTFRVAPSRAPSLRRAAGLALTGLLLLPTVDAIARGDVPVRPLDLDLYARLLDRHTRVVPELVGTRVDYRTLARSTDWGRLVAQVRAARPSTLSRDERLAFWINAYNILAIDLVIQELPRSRASRTSAPSSAPSGTKDAGTHRRGKALLPR